MAVNHRVAIPLLALALAVAGGIGCAGEAGPPGSGRPQTSDDEARLGLTRSVPDRLKHACQAAARESDLAVFCPPLVPDGELSVSGLGLDQTEESRSSTYLIDLHSRAIDRPSNGHWVVAAGDAARLKLLTSEPSLPAPLSRRGLNLGGIPVTVYKLAPYEAGGGFYGGHIALAWTHDGLVYHVSVHGYQNGRRAIAIAKALIAQMTGCSQTEPPAQDPCDLIFD